MNHFILTLELHHRWLSNAIIHKSLIWHRGGCRECKDFLSSELPQTFDALTMGKVRALINNEIILIQYDYITPGSIWVESVDWGDRDAVVDDCKFLRSLLAQGLVRFHHYYSLAHVTVVLGNESLYPSLPWPCRRHHDCEVSVMRHSYPCNGSLQLGVSVIFYLHADWLRHIEDFFERYH